MRIRSSKNRHHRHHVKVLKSEVMSPRIAWFNFLDLLKIFTKITILVAVLFVVFYGIRQAIQFTFHQNPDFRLQAINLNPNHVIDETDLVEHLKIDLAANIFDFDIELMEQKLLEIPAIESAKIERELPGTLSFQIVTRQPMAWIASPDEGLLASRELNQLLIDHNHFIYPCPENQLEHAAKLPIIQLKANPDHPIRAGLALNHPEYRRCIQILKSFHAAFPDDVAMIESIYQLNPWSVNLTTRDGTLATFGLDGHTRQLDYLSKALHHAEKKGYEIETINLIPKQNVPITVRNEVQPPRAIPVRESDLQSSSPSRQNQDLQSLLNRN